MIDARENSAGQDETAHTPVTEQRHTHVEASEMRLKGETHQSGGNCVEDVPAGATVAAGASVDAGA